MLELAKEIVNGKRLLRGDNTDILLNSDLEELCEGADYIRKELCRDRADLCAIINGRSGACSENCKFCSQSAHYTTSCQKSDFIDIDEILEGCRKAAAQGIDRYCIVTAGRAISPADFEKALAAYKKMHEEFPDLILCASHGFVSEENLERLKEAGVSMYHENIETSESNFPNVCSTHSFQDKIDEIRRIQKAGLELCTGGIIGMGETWEDRMDMAFTLRELEITSIPINILQPIPGTPLEHMEPLTEEEILRTIAMFRYINPEAAVRLAAGRNHLSHSGEAVFRCGANAAITGDMLTTSGNNIAEDQEMLTKMGFEY